MYQKHLTQVWQWMSVVCVLFLVTSVISIQGGSEFIGRLFGDKAGSLPDNKPAIGYFGAIIGGVLFLIASFVLYLHAYRHGTRWHSRVPTVWLEGLNTDVWDGKCFQIIVLTLFLGLPAAGIVLCTMEAERGDICEQDAAHFYKGSDTTLLLPPKAIDPRNQMRLRREGSGSEECKKTGIEILPTFWSPFLVYGLPSLSFCMAFAAIGTILLGPFRKTAPASGGNSEADDLATSG
ncbi:hypothetical protein [Bradyrhizobium sp. LA2.1]|uniref:hypothetical protein n=1 Tax=Bradyrhizobium sp. LA2.1 TaxID=3156376 RepID=UPI003398C16E